MTRNLDRPRGPRRLTSEERKLWRDVTRTIAPLRPQAGDALPADEPAPVEARKPLPEPLPAYVPPPPPRPKAPPALAPLAQRDRRRLARGRTEVDARVDLHGMTQAQAHAVLANFLHRAQSDGAKVVLVITGKGGRGDGPDRERGVLRRQVPQWLALPELRSLVVGFETATIGHGGEGALYVRIRRRR